MRIHRLMGYPVLSIAGLALLLATGASAEPGKDRAKPVGQVVPAHSKLIKACGKAGAAPYARGVGKRPNKCATQYRQQLRWGAVKPSRK